MNTQIFVNLPVKDLQKSMAFFSTLGYSFNPDFTDDKGACMIISPDIYAMLLTEPFFAGFTPNKQICDAKKSTEVMIAVSCQTRDEVDQKVAKAFDAGGRIHGEPKDHGFMYYHAFEDLDGHIWELLHLVPQETKH